MNFIDRLINSITMYRLVLYGLMIMVTYSVLLSLTGALFYPAWSLLASSLLLLMVCYGSNLLFSKLLRAPTNVESAAITALILFFIMPPIASQTDALLLVVTGIVAMASKYLLVIRKNHFLNPAAAGALIMGLTFGFDASWWVGSLSMLPIVLIVGFLVVRKIREFSLFFAFFLPALATILLTGVISRDIVAVDGFVDLFLESLTSWPLFFFGAIMLTEPLTSPSTHRLQMVYGAIVGIIFGSPFELGPFYATPELALVIGNIFSAIANPQRRLFLNLKEKKQLSPDIYHFSFGSDKPLKFSPGQYLEWTLPHPNSDSRGNRRYFTIASAPTEDHLAIGVKIQPNSSSFKKALLGLSPGEKIVASQLAGDFTLPQDLSQKLVFIAGGVGITPFRSMIKHLLDLDTRANIVLFYACLKPTDFAYQQLFERAEQAIGVKTVYVVTDVRSAAADWQGYSGFITSDMIKTEVPDYAERMFYLSGPSAMVDAYKKLLSDLGVNQKNIMTDYFPGF